MQQTVCLVIFFISKPIKIIFGFASAILLLSFCNDKSTQPQESVSLNQIPGCQHLRLNKSESSDSCFTYTFKKDLVLDFCASGNCCPDKNRFDLSSKIFNDTIQIVVKDTAQNLCKCNCNYIIHGEFKELPADRYVIKLLYVSNGNQITTKFFILAR